jgi:hypothetical protein
MLRPLAASALILLAACVEEPPIAIPGDDACGASALQDLVGQPARVLDGMRFADPVRVIRPGMAVTMDYSPNRLNIEIDAAEVIARVVCG